MPKRKKDKRDDCYLDYLAKKLKKIERKISRKRRRRTSSSSRNNNNITLPSPIGSEPIATIDIDVTEPQAGCSYWDELLEQPNAISHHADAADTVTTAAVPDPSASSQLQAPLDIGNCTESSTILPDATTELTLNPELLSILGDDPTTVKEYGENIQKDLAVRLSHIVTNGLSNENRKELKEKYLAPANCKLIKAPALNAEIRASLADSQEKRDKGIESKQTLTSCALSSLCAAITLLLSSNDANQKLLKLLMDTVRILAGNQHSDSALRRCFILSTLKKELKEQLEKTKIDEWLFGNNLTETLKSAKIITKSGADIRSAARPGAQKPANAVAATSKQPLNYRAPLANQRVPPPQAAAAARGFRPPARQTTVRRTTTSTQHVVASKMSTHQQPPRRRR